MIKAKTEQIVLGEYSTYELDGSLDSIIEQLTEYRREAYNRGLTNVRLTTDWHDEPVYAYGGYDGTSERVWAITVVADKFTPAVYKTKLPKKVYDNAFALGAEAASKGWERRSPAEGMREGIAWLEGFDSVYKDVHTEHCCSKHGCKYGDKACPVATGKKKQSYPCEICHEDIGGVMR